MVEIETLPARLMVGHRPLEAGIGVRVPGRQLWKFVRGSLLHKFTLPLLKDSKAGLSEGERSGVEKIFNKKLFVIEPLARHFNKTKILIE